MSRISKLLLVGAAWYTLGAGASLIFRNAEYLHHCNEMALLFIVAAGVWRGE